jgi:hypothetical protein
MALVACEGMFPRTNHIVHGIIMYLFVDDFVQLNNKTGKVQSVPEYTVTTGVLCTSAF